MQEEQNIQEQLKKLNALLQTFNSKNDIIYQQLLKLKTKIIERKSEKSAEDVRNKIKNF